MFKRTTPSRCLGSRTCRLAATLVAALLLGLLPAAPAAAFGGNVRAAAPAAPVPAGPEKAPGKAPEKAPGKATVGQVGAQLAPALPWLLGMDAPRTYLVLIQNSHELRATGGFVAALARITVDKGRIADIDFSDSYRIYKETSTYPPAPRPLQDYMGIAILLLRDANWSPDLPTAAQVARVLYAQDTGQQVDGVFTVNLAAVRHLLGALGPIDVPEGEQPITADNIEEQVIRFWERPSGSDATIAEGMNMDWFAQRKDFIPVIAKAALAKVQNGDVDYGSLLTGVQAAMNDRSIQGWVNNPQVQQVLAEARWDGGLHPEAGADFLAVVDSNMGYNKVDAAMQRAVDYRVAWPDGPAQPALATLTLTYTHPIEAEDPGCEQSPRYGTTYADMIARCYFDYVRVFAPAGSQLVSMDGVQPETVVGRVGERNTYEMAGFFVMPPNSERSVRLTYRLPAGLTPDSYRLVAQRQAGTNPLPFTVQVGDALPDRFTVEDGWFAYPQPNG